MSPSREGGVRFIGVVCVNIMCATVGLAVLYADGASTAKSN